LSCHAVHPSATAATAATTFTIATVTTTTTIIIVVVIVIIAVVHIVIDNEERGNLIVPRAHISALPRVHFRGVNSTSNVLV
jgi:hypothetical protein